MEKQKRWHTFLIVAVILLTVYNVLPTILFYTKPLSKAIDKPRAQTIAVEAIERVNDLEKDSIEWVKSFCKLLNLKSDFVKMHKDNPQILEVGFTEPKDAAKFKKHLPRAGSLVPFYPSQLSNGYIGDTADGEDSVIAEEKESSIVYVQRKIPVQFDPNRTDSYFSFVEKYDKNGAPTEQYTSLLSDRLLQVGLSIGGISENAHLLGLALQNFNQTRGDELLFMLSQNILGYEQVFGANSAAANRFYSSLTQGDFSNKPASIKRFIEALSQYKDRIQFERIALQEKSDELKKTGGFLEGYDQQRLSTLTAKEDKILRTLTIVRQNEQTFASGKEAWDYDILDQKIRRSFSSGKNGSTHSEFISVGSNNPIIDKLGIDWENENIVIFVKPDILKMISSSNTQGGKRELLNQLLYNEIAKIARESNEKISPDGTEFQIALSELDGSKSLLTFELATIAKSLTKHVKSLLKGGWNPESQDLKSEFYPILDFVSYQSLPKEQRNLSLVIYAPSTVAESPLTGFRNGSIYVVAKDLGKIIQKFQANPNSTSAKQFFADFEALQTLLRSNGFNGYPGTTYPLAAEFADDYIFESEDFFLPILQATRENFTVHGTGKLAVLELSDVKQRIFAWNRIEDQIHEDLLKWKDEFNSSQVNLAESAKYDVPAPTKNVFWSNFLLSCKKYFRGDERKIISWGLDLSGGRTVLLALKDANNQAVTNETDIRQGINELYSRVNKMGVSDVSIRQEGSNIAIDFPGSKNLSASDLIKASSMTFNIVNEKFRTQGGALSDLVNRFLQDVWNEAVVTNKKDIEQINQIALSHLYGDSLDPEFAQPRSDTARALFENGLRLPNLDIKEVSNAFNDSTSKIAIYRGDNFSDWYGQTHPLLIVFNNYALEGTSLENVHANYDPTKGNYLSFEVKGSQIGGEGVKTNPRKDLYAWTSVFAREKIIGTPYEAYSSGQGWRMAVILNGYVVSSPTLDAPLKDSAMISGRFTQREVNHLVADLKAGSLSFTPQILSEKSVSPDLGVKERTQGIMATIVALIVVVATMTAYYRFAGMIASIAVLLNLLIIWATLQNIQASITLAGIAGIILTVGMAVDANVLVFERIREEFSSGGKIATAVQIGYKKAFSAIADSNITTLIAALILLNFDSGPIKGFAVTLIIGIVSSMFTALFMTRYFFNRWVRNPKHTKLTMANLIKPKNFSFLRFAKPTIGFGLALIVLGIFSLYKEKGTILGMDFTGGYALSLELETKADGNYRSTVEKALTNAGLSTNDFQIRELTPANHLRISFSPSMNAKGKPFYGLPLNSPSESVTTYSYETNPRLVWLVNQLAKDNIHLTERSLTQLDQNWKSISGQMSDTMRNNALIGLGFALLSILVYITIRFEFKYAVSATIALAFDLLVTLSILGILHLFGVPIQIDLNTVAALMTIIGYSLNDTIIVFDRVREDVKLMRKRPFSEVVNRSLNFTLSRTILTSLTTLFVLLSLVILGGSTIFGFSLVMTIGVIVGTLSTFFVASPFLLFFQKVESKDGDDLVLNGS